MSRLDIAVNCAWVLLGLAICWQSVPLGLVGPSGPGSGLFPLLAGMLVAGAGGGLLLGAAMGRAPPLGQPRFFMARGAAFRAAALILVTAGMILLVPQAGFVLAGVVGLPLLFKVIAPEAPWWFAALVGIGASGAVHLLFGVLLGTPLPRGPLGF